MSPRIAPPLDPIWYSAFPLYYLGITAYGVVVALVPLPSLEQVNGTDYAIAWGAALAVLGLATSRASIYPGGTRLVRVHGRVQSWVEAILTALVCSLLLGYAYIVVAAVAAFGETGRLGGAVVAVLLCWFPTVNVLAIIRSGRLRPREG